VLERDDTKPEPDWSRVPQFKRDEVRARWIERHAIRHEGKEDDLWWVWGPQIALYEAHAGYRIRVHDESARRGEA
jgi:hypothetical protein